MTEISNSQDLIGAEVFAEPFSFVCLMGSKFVDEDLVKLSHQDEKKVMKFSAVLSCLKESFQRLSDIKLWLSCIKQVAISI